MRKINNILVVEDNPIIARLIINKIKTELDFDVKWESAYSGAKRLIKEQNTDFVIAL